MSRLPSLGGVLSGGAWLPLLRRLPPSACQSVGLSFDDGPSTTTTPALIELLRRHDASASFFLTGERAVAAPHLIAALVAAGHDVFAHGWSHVAYASETPDLLARDMDRTEHLLRRFRPTPEPYLVRLPYMSGRRSARVHRIIRAWKPDAQLAFWQFGLTDYRLAVDCVDRTELASRCAAAAETVLAHRGLPGAILLLHEEPYDVDAPLSGAVAPLLAGLILDGLARRGLRGVKLQPMRRQPWFSRFVQL